MIIKHKPLVFVLSIIVVAALFFLATGLSGVHLSPGRPDVFTFGAGPITGPQTGLAQDTSFMMLLRILYIIAVALLPVIIILLIVSKQARKQFLRSLIGILPILFLLFAFHQLTQQPKAADAVPAGAGAPSQNTQAGTKPTVITPVATPAWVVTAATAGVAVVITALIAGIAWYIIRKNRKEESPFGRIAQEAQNALDALKSGANLRNVVIRCYYQMNEILKEERGIHREEFMTPREFETWLEKGGLPGSAIKELTRLFEEVRYGTHVPDMEDEVVAIASLTAIVDALKVH